MFIPLQVTHSHLHELWGAQYNPHTNFFNSFQSSKLFIDVFPFLSSDPLEIQIATGCELLPRNISESFLRAAFQGKDVLSFQGMSWASAPDAPPLIEEVIKVLNQDQGTKETVHWLLHDICPELVRGLLQTRKSELEKQGQPAFVTSCLHSTLGLHLGFSFQGSHPFKHHGKKRGWIRCEGI